MNSFGTRRSAVNVSRRARSGTSVCSILKTASADALRWNPEVFTVRSLVIRLSALGVLLLLDVLAPTAGIAALASCLAHLPGPATLDSDRIGQ